jgi:UDP-glucose 4-epimerase
MKNILVTGSAGYIGYNLCVQLLREGYNVLQLDKAQGSNIIDVDLYHDYPDVDHIVHLAALTSVQGVAENLSQAIVDNVLATEKIFRFAEEMDVPVIFASSGAARDPHANEYAMQKLVGEISASVINDRSRKVLVQVIRLSNVFGGAGYLEKKSSVVARFLRASMKRMPIMVHGDGSQVRDFIHVSEVVRAIMMIISEWRSRNPYNAGHPIDICTGVGRKIIDVASMVDPVGATKTEEFSLVGVEKNVGDPGPAQKLFNYRAEDLLEGYIESMKKN